jgi:hypothetical protein
VGGKELVGAGGYGAGGFRWLSVALDRKRKGHNRGVWYVMVDIYLSLSTAYIGKSGLVARSELFTRTIVLANGAIQFLEKFSF